jgi:ELWxxDGT repeat protein
MYRYISARGKIAGKCPVEYDETSANIPAAYVRFGELMRLHSLSFLTVSMVASFAGFAAAASFTPSLIKDGLGVVEPAEPTIYVAGDGQLYFVAGYFGTPRVWTSDGTPDGTFPFSDVAAYIGGSAWDFQAVVGDTFFFAGTDSAGTELWKGGGTQVGTSRVKDIRPGSQGSGPSQLLPVGSTLYFQGDGGTSNGGLWKSDGTELGTELVTQITFGSIDRMVTAGNTIYFSAIDDVAGFELWRSDGTAAGTGVVRDIRTGPFSSSPGELTAVGNELFFTASSGTGRPRVWKTNGTEAGTVQVSNVGSDGVAELTGVNGTLFFTADDPATGEELYKSDGTEAGTVLVKDIDPRIAIPGPLPFGASSSSPRNLTNVNGTLYFTANDGFHGRELWKSDGTSDGTQMVIDLSPGSDSTGFAYSSGVVPSKFIAAGDLLFFTAYTRDTVARTTDHSLFVTDGTAAGTMAVLTFPSSAGRPIGGLAFDGRNLFFRAGTQFTPTGFATRYGLFSIQVVPEPGTWALALGACAAISGIRKRRRT